MYIFSYMRWHIVTYLAEGQAVPIWKRTTAEQRLIGGCKMDNNG